MLKETLNLFGKKEIDVYEWDRPDVLQARLPDNSRWEDLAAAHRPMRFTGWALAHAVVKADYLESRGRFLPSLGFLLQCHDILAPVVGGNLRLTDGGSNILNDVTQTSLAGRLGQGLSILFAQSVGYRFAGHLSSDPQVQQHRRNRQLNQVADFLFEDSNNDRMVLESKASFKLGTNSPTKVKAKLKNALETQVTPWMGALAPAAQKGFAVYSCLREISSTVPSALIFVDPPEENTKSAKELPKDWTRKSSFSSWLPAMGLESPAQKLQGLKSVESLTVDLDIAIVNERKFAVAPFLPKQLGNTDIFVGMELEAVSEIEHAIRDEEYQLTSYRGLKSEAIFQDEVSMGSIMTDGTFFGSRECFQEIQGSKSFSF